MGRSVEGGFVGHMRVLRVLSEQWPEVSGRLSADTLGYLAELVGSLARAAPGSAATVAADVTRLLRQVLPQDDSRLRQVLDAGEERGLTETEDWAAVAQDLLRQVGEADLTAAPSPSPEEVSFWASRWLLGHAALSEDDLLDRGLDPYDAGLIRLERDDGGEQWPEFQFGPDGAPLPVVKAINRLLDAEDDPWGVADWWLGHNRWLAGVPARLIGEIDDGELTEAARAVDPGV